MPAAAAAEPADLLSMQASPLLERSGIVCLGLFLLTLLHLIMLRCFFGTDWSAVDLPWLWQIPSTARMRAMPFQSIWYWHCYPSGFVAYWVALINLFGEQGGRLACQWIYLVGCATLTPAAYAIGLALCRVRSAALIGSLVVGASPTLPLYAAYYVYDAPTMVLATGALACVAMYELSGRKTGWLVAATWLCSGLVLIRAIFHLFILIPLLLAVIRARPGWRMLLASGLAAALSAAMYLKNLLLFGVFASSSMLGFNYSKMVLWPLTPPQIERFRQNHDLTPLVADYPLFYYMVDPRQAENGQPIYRRYGYTQVGQSDLLNQTDANNINCIAIAAEYGACARRVLWQYPWSFLRAVRLAYWKFCSPPSRSEWFDNSPVRIEPYQTIYLDVFYAEWLRRSFKDDLGLAMIPSITYFLLPTVVGVFVLRQSMACRFSPRRWAGAFRANLTLYAAIGLIVYVSALSCLLEVNENDRYFTYIEPALVMVTTAGILGLGRLMIRHIPWHHAEKTKAGANFNGT